MNSTEVKIRIDPPEVRYSIPGIPGFLEPADPVLDIPLTPGSDTVLIRDFLDAAAGFLSRDNWQVLIQALSELDRTLPGKAIESVCLLLEKHGAFYHPVQVQIFHGTERIASLALNGAVSEPGLSLAEREFHTIDAFNRNAPSRFLPQVFACGCVPLRDRKAAFFLGEWFEEYNEFHVTLAGGRQSLGVWEPDGSIRRMAMEAGLDIYRQASRILTFFYNPITFEQIIPWHHAAGDFVIRDQACGIDVRLITVRGYAPMIGDPSEDAPDGDDIIYNLLFFLLNLTLRMRIDRIDGTGDYLFLDEIVLQPVLTGFFEEIMKKPLLMKTDNGLLFRLHDTLRHLPLESVRELMTILVGAWNPNSPEIPVITANLDDHAAAFYRQIGRISKKSFFIDKAV